MRTGWAAIASLLLLAALPGRVAAEAARPTEVPHREVPSAGRLELFVPDTLEFAPTPISPVPVMVGRAEAGWGLTVVDTRGGGGGWALCVRLTGDLTPEDGGCPPLRDALVYVWAPGEMAPIPVDREEELFYHMTEEETEVFTVVWPEDCGPMLAVLPLGVCADVPYTTRLVWTLVDGP